ncbi:PP2C family protein-serine/threonine phosphatase [Streptomyces sp. RM1]|uniref:PP2C family protein-serine/threonine phosphatase n=1 Tax=Streptomyces misionensis TaxID=67331 RepID=UPI003BB053AA
MTYPRHHPRRLCGQGYAWLLPSLLLVGIVLLDFNTGAEYRFVSWTVLVPGIAAAICGVRTTACFCVVSLVAYVLVDNAWPDQYRAGFADFLLVALGGALATVVSALRVRQERHALRMEDVAAATVRAVLRPLPERWAGLEQAGAYFPADVEAQVGGDFYDIQPGPYGTRVLVGDVQGKGTGAVEAAAALLGSFREAGYYEKDLGTVAERLEIRMLRLRIHTTAIGRRDGDRFATAVLVAFLAGPRGVRELPCGEGLPIGLSDLAGGLPPVHQVPLAEDETLLLYTDGVTEARDRHGEFYDLLGEVTEAVAADPCCTVPERLVRRVHDGVRRHSGGVLADDTTIFAVRRLPVGDEAPRTAVFPGWDSGSRLPDRVWAGEDPERGSSAS